MVDTLGCCCPVLLSRRLRHITKRFKFTAVKGPPAAGPDADGGASAAAAAGLRGPSGTAARQRSREELKAAAATGGAGKNGTPEIHGRIGCRS